MPSADNDSAKRIVNAHAPSGNSAGSIIISRRLRWLVLTGTFGLLLFTGVATNALLQIRINSPLYRTISLSNNLIADYVPPSESLLQPSLLCAKLVDAPNKESRQIYETKLRTLRREYNSKYADYMYRVPEGELKTMMRGEAHQTAQEYFGLVDQLEALVNQNRIGEARTLLATTMNPLYDRHAAAVDQIVIRAKDEARSAEALAAHSVDIYTVTMVVVGLFILFFECALSWFIAKGVYTQAKKLTKSEESLRASEELYHSTFDQAAVGILHVSFEGKVLRSNTRFAEILGYPIEEIPGKTLQQLTPPEHLANGDEASQQLVAGVSSRVGLEKPYLRKDGTLAWVKLSSSVQRDSNGQSIFIVTFVEDITERRAVETRLAAAMGALQLSESRYRELFDGALEGIFRTSPEGKTLLANPALARMLGYDSPDEVLLEVTDTAASVWIDPDARAEYVRHLEEHGTILGYECRFKRKDGTAIWVSTNCKKVCGPTGQTLYYEGFIENITERKLSQRKILERDERLRQAEGLALIGSSSWDVDSNTTVWSYGMFQITGRQPGSPTPSPEERKKIYKAESYVRLSNAAARTLATGEPYDLELQIVRMDGAVRWVRARGVGVRNDEGRVVRIIGTLQDINKRKTSELKLRDNEERFRSTFEQAAIGILHVSFEGQVLSCNKRFADNIGYPIDEVIGRNIEDFTPPEHMPTSNQFILELRRDDRGGRAIEKPYRRKDGSLTWVKLTSSIQRDGKGKPLHFVTFVESIDERKAAEEHLALKVEQLRASEERYRTVFQTPLIAVAITRLSDGIYIDVNQTFLDVLGFTREEVIGRTWRDLNIWVDPHEREKVEADLRRNLVCHDIEAQYRTKDGQSVWGLISASIVNIDGVPCVIAVGKDITDTKNAGKIIQDLAFYDQLTRLPNRRSLLDKLLQSHSAPGCKRALLFVDLGNFKSLNDALGHHSGDAVLKEVARRLTECVRGEGTVAHLGGDEFAILLENLSEIPEDAASQARIIGERVLSAGSQPYLIADREYHCPPSIGITVFGNEPDAHTEALQQGDIAMSHAKEVGSSSIRFFSPALQAAINTRVAMENDLRQALKTNQFLLHFQPQVKGSQLIGAEALVRWRHPKQGLLGPAVFVDLAQETGLIVALGDWVLESAGKQSVVWEASQKLLPISVAVNMSAREFHQPDFVKRILTSFDRSKANPSNLTLEVTESTLIDDLEDVIAKMTELRSHGVQFSLDDFGTGYSSLAYLNRLPLDQIKIDRAFVRDILVDAASVAIARAIISMGHTMGFSVIAEGVETEEQKDVLVSLGCELFQGYLFGRPLPVEEFESVWMSSELDPGSKSNSRL